MKELWTSTESSWRRALESYSEVVARQGVARLPELDRWYHDDLPGTVTSRQRAHVTLPELVRVTEWKMARGVRRPRATRRRLDAGHAGARLWAHVGGKAGVE